MENVYIMEREMELTSVNMEVEMQEQQMHCVRLERKQEQLLLQETV